MFEMYDHQSKIIFCLFESDHKLLGSTKNFLDPETDIKGQFLGPETDIMGERYFINDIADNPN